MSFQFHKNLRPSMVRAAETPRRFFTFESVGHLWEAFSFNPKFQTYGNFKTSVATATDPELYRTPGATATGYCRL